jgi:hypothetical protein
MAHKTQSPSQPLHALRKLALGYPEAEEGIACKGTKLECIAFQARKKTFLFLGDAELKVKLGASLPEASRLAAKEPARFQAGPMGWVTVKFSAERPPPLDVLTRWIDESYRLVAPKGLVTMLAEGGLSATGGKRAKKKAAGKKVGKK